MRNRILMNACLLLGFFVQGMGAQSLYIANKEGQQMAYSLEDIRKISFSEDQITLFTSDGSSDSYVLSELLNLHYRQVTSVQQKPLQVRNAGILYIYPNPVHDRLHIQWPSSQGVPGLVDIYSLEGKKALTREIKPHTPVYQLDISDLPGGMYVCRIHLGTKIQSARFIKQ